ncbi:MAG: hypothetical protein Q9163_002756 [Psora crenata]
MAHSRDSEPPAPEALPVAAANSVTSLNTYGYSPYPLSYYLQAVSEMINRDPGGGTARKPIIISVTGIPEEIAEAWAIISRYQAGLGKPPAGTGKENPLTPIHPLSNTQQQQRQEEHRVPPRLLMEINLSCPNIAGYPPPAYSKSELLRHLTALAGKAATTNSSDSSSSTGSENLNTRVEIGIKTPPYTHQPQFDELVAALLEYTAFLPQKQSCPVTFITATNTLGSSLLLTQDASTGSYRPTLAGSCGSGIGGLAGSAIHPLALGNVATLRRMLDQHESLKRIEIIGVGGVSDRAGFERMKNVGASAVGVGTALGTGGVGVFERILEGDG